MQLHTYSNTLSVTTIDISPLAPTDLRSSGITSTQIDLSWTDNSNNETNFTIESRRAGGTFAEIAVVTANATNHQDTGLTPATTYEFRVRAKNAQGNSAYCEVATWLGQETPFLFKINWVPTNLMKLN